MPSNIWKFQHIIVIAVNHDFIDDGMYMVLHMDKLLMSACPSINSQPSAVASSDVTESRRPAVL